MRDLFLCHFHDDGSDWSTDLTKFSMGTFLGNKKEALLLKDLDDRLEIYRSRHVAVLAERYLVVPL